MRAASSLLSRAVRQVLLVLLPQAIEQSALAARGHAGRQGEVVDRRLVGRAGRRPDTRPACSRCDQFFGPLIGPPVVVEHDDEAGQVLVLAAEAVGHPRAQARVAAERSRPEFIISRAEPWIGDSAYMEWRKAMSSTQRAEVAGTDR